MNDLTPEEQEFLDSVEGQEWQSIPKLKEEINRYRSYAQAHLECNPIIN